MFRTHPIRIFIVTSTVVVLACMAVPVLADCTSIHNGSGNDYVCTDTTTVLDGTPYSDNIVNNGTILTYVWGGSFTVNAAQQDIITNNGIVGSGQGDDGMWGSPGNDTIINNGIVNGGTWYSWEGVNGAIFGDDSAGFNDHDTITVNNTVNGNVHGDYSAGGNDIITINGRVNGGVYGEGNESVQFGRYGNDTIILANNAIVTTVIDGMGGNDLLRFDFSVADEATYIAISNQISSASPASGSLTFNGNTFTWLNFEVLENSVEWTQLPNQEPTAAIASPTEGQVFTAGVTGTALVALDATGSSDSDGTISSYNWTWTGTSSGSASGSPINHAFGVGSYTLTLTVTDDDGATDTETRSFTVQAAPNQVPTAAIASPTEGQVFTAGVTGTVLVTLDANGSSDSDGTIGSYNWTWMGTSSGSASGSLINHNFGVGSYTLTLTVTDDDGATDTETRSFSVQAAPNQAPTAAITAPTQGQMFTADETGIASVTLNAAGSSDADGSIVSYGWMWTGTASGTASGGATVESFVVGSYNLTLTVTDDDGATDTETRSFSVQAGSPVDAVPELNYSVGDRVTLTWGGITWATGYEVEISNSSSFDPLACGGTIPVEAGTLSVTTCSLTPQTTYYWRVRAVSVSRTSPWSIPVSFVIAAP